MFEFKLTALCLLVASIVALSDVDGNILAKTFLAKNIRAKLKRALTLHG